MGQQLFKGVRWGVILVSQAAMVVAAFVGANYLRYDNAFTPHHLAVIGSLLVPLVLIKLPCFTMMKLLSGWWRYVSIHDLVALVKANLLGSFLFAVYLAYPQGSSMQLPTSLLVLDGLLCFLIMSGTRVAVRLFREYLQQMCKSCCKETEKVIIVGAGAAGQSIAREIQQNPHLDWKVVGFVDQDRTRVRQCFQGVPVLATIDGLKDLLRTKPATLVILANAALCHKELRRIVAVCQEQGVKSKILPNVCEILSGELSIQHVRDVKLDDLLGRPAVRLDVSNIKDYLKGKRVLVTGAAGSIGSEICRQVASFGAANVILFDNAETPLFQIERELRQQFPAMEFIPRLSDIRDPWQVDYIFRLYRPEVVFHAAAYKHVPMSEYNPLAALENNILGTRLLVNAADRYNVKQFVMVSTDKAVNPTNIMGASKRAAEVYTQALARTSQTQIMTVRFGNVLGSNGSVVPIFQDQIRNGGPVTVTDPKATRFFMTVSEAVQLVLQAGSMGQGGEIFVLDMGEQIHILHLAEELIRLSGMTPYKDIDIVFTGLRPGEKLYEELLHGDEGVFKTNHEKICVAQARWNDPAMLNLLMDDLTQACRAMDREQAMRIITTLVPEYKTRRTSPAENVSRLKVHKPQPCSFPIGTAETA